MFGWKWYLKDLKQDKPVKVFSCFSCGGGSSMGYKRAGFDVIGNVEIDSRINEVYVKNLNPKYNFNMDLRQFNLLDDLPDELYNLDILDGSPPCTTFSMAGEREKTWRKAKKFSEGQIEQTLDDLFFVFIDTVEKLKPKIVIAENVTGLISGNAKGYVNEIINRFRQAGYDVQMFKLNAALMNVPQIRERIFFIANNQRYPKLQLDFHEKPILFGEVRSEHGKPLTEKSVRIKYLLEQATIDDMKLSDIVERLEGRKSLFNLMINHDRRVAYTVVASCENYRFCDKSYLSNEDLINISTFPQDYDFCGRSVQHICGMSVPPNMMANLATEIYKQWLMR